MMPTWVILVALPPALFMKPRILPNRGSRTPSAQNDAVRLLGEVIE